MSASSRTSSASVSKALARKRRPCDRCHTIKEKCRWPSEDSETCDRCLRLGFECKTNRPVAQSGRKPRLATGNRLSLRKTTSKAGGPPTDATPSPTEGDASIGSPLVTSPACHHHSRLAPRWVSPSPSEVGRGNHQNSLNHHQRIVLFPDLTRLEMHFLDAMLHRQFEVDKYLIGPSFRYQQQQAFTSHLNAGLPFVKDAFIACATLLVGDEHLQQLAKDQQVGYRRAAAAMRRLRELQTCQFHELPMVLILGVALSTFALHHSGAPSALIRYLLGIVKQLYDNDFSLLQRLGSDGLASLICLLGTETEGCLILGQVPSIRIRVEDLDQKVDRFIGISAPMLTHFNDICELAQGIRQSGCRRRNRLPEMALQRSVLQLEQKLEKWQPATSVDLLGSRFTLAEVQAMLSQAKILRLTALLIMHRLRYPFGNQDAKAAKFSEAIVKELSMLVRRTGRSVPFAELAFLVACFELNDPVARQTAMAEAYQVVDFSPLVRQGQEKWLLKFWAVKDDKGHDPIHWDDLASVLGEVES